MEEYSALSAESGRAFQLQAWPKRESSFPAGPGQRAFQAAPAGIPGLDTTLTGFPRQVVMGSRSAGLGSEELLSIVSSLQQPEWLSKR